MAAFPGGLASFTGFTSSHTLAADNHAAQHNLEQGEILAVQTKVGTGSSTSTSGTVLRGTGAGTSSWGQVTLTTDVTGILPVANGGNGTASTTGSGSAVFGTSPTISGASLTSSPTLTTPTIADFTNATHTHASNAQGGQLTASAFANNAITAPLLSTSAIKLGYAEISTNFTTTSVTAVQVTSLTITVTIPDGGRSVEIIVFAPGLYNSVATNQTSMSLWDGTVGSGTELAYGYGMANGSGATSGYIHAVVTPSAGSKTYNVGLQVSAGTGTIECGAAGKAFILARNL